MALHLSVKHVQINKANNQLAVVVAIAVVVSVFCLVSAKDLLSQSSYQRKVLSAKNKAAGQLKSDLDAANQLVSQYKVFESQDPNIIGGQGGSNPGDGPQDGDNARIVLDALPSQYDFPALVSSLEKILTADSMTIQGISGTDEGEPSAPSDPNNIQPVPMAFSVDALNNYAGVRKMIQDFEKSIRPIDVTNLQLTGSQNSMHVTVQANTYYQPEKDFALGQQEVR